VQDSSFLDAAAAGREYLASFPAALRRRGDALASAGMVQAVERTPDGFAGRVLTPRAFGAEVTYDPDSGWSGECACSTALDCEHCYALLKHVLPELTLEAVRALSRGSASRGGSRPEPGAPSGRRGAELAPVGEFQVEVAKALGRWLRPDEKRALDALHALWLSAQHGQGLTVWDLERAGLSPGGSGWEVLNLWPAPPKSEREFWLYLANALIERGRPVPEFLKPVSDVRAVQETVRQWRREAEIQRWREILANEHSESSARARPQVPVDFRIVLAEHEARFHWLRPGATEFEPLRASQFQELVQHLNEGIQTFTPAADFLVQLLRHRLTYGRSLDLRYGDAEADRLLGHLLRQPLLEDHVVTPTGEPVTFAPDPVRWELVPPGTRDGDYVLRLVQADGQPLAPILVTVRGRPSLYATAGAVYRGARPHPGLLQPGKDNSIPAPALESREGVRLLQALDVELPPELRARVRTVPMRVSIRCELAPIYPGSQTEQCLFEVRAASEDGAQRELWNGTGWDPVTSRRPPRARKSADSGDAIPFYDRSALDAVPALMAPLGLRYDPYAARPVLRVTRKFPEQFIAWLQTVPPQIPVQLEGELASLNETTVAGKVRLDAAEAAIDWFDLRVVLDVSDTTLTPEELKLLLNAKGAFVRLGNKGWRRLEFQLTEDEDRQLAKLGLNPRDLSAEPQRLHALQLADDAARHFLPDAQVDRLQRRATEIRARVTPPLPGSVTATLRPYQLAGFHFLAYLAANRFGGILADDMGLGKTLQTLAWLVWLRQDGPAGQGPSGHAPPPADRVVVAAAGAAGSPAAEGAESPPAQPPAGSAAPALVVCPKSVMDNWVAEAARFTPGLRVRLWRAPELGSFADELATADLHVLNYSQLRMLGEGLGSVHWLAVILDEGQYIKNPNSQTAQIARALRADYRLVLSGTPIENRLLDLWSLLTFAMPGVLGSRTQFARVYDAKDDPFARSRLAARVRPFLLRRTKAQVAADLPDRIEEDLFCEMEGDQKLLYQAELKRAQQLLLKIKTQKELADQQFHFLVSLLRLRQICCHPELVAPESKTESAKVNALMEQLEPIVAEGHKVLVFSQFVGLLERLKPLLTAEGWTHFYLAGATENRGELVREFQAAEGAAVFLISLKAGGFGLNLTAASYVVLFDPWWNPAVENQAIDRTHRIGQTQKVIAYRLLIKNSIEEKIRALQRQKSALAEDVLGEERFSQSLTLDDLRFLFAD
jgi:hypothetical protein